MILFAREHCPHCPPDLKETIKKLGGHVFDVVQHPDGKPYVQFEPQKFSPLPKNITGLPALFTEDHIYMGLDPILGFINLNKETMHAR